ncbi:MAG: hypothetical protein ACRDTF_07535 [Pseudonocardiaceae bacterium]
MFGIRGLRARFAAVIAAWRPAVTPRGAHRIVPVNSVALAEAASRRVLFLPMTDATGGAHQVSEDAVVSGRRKGRYTALCGKKIIAASLTTLEQRHCGRCIELKRAFDALRRGNPAQNPAGPHHRQRARHGDRHA